MGNPKMNPKQDAAPIWWMPGDIPGRFREEEWRVVCGESHKPLCLILDPDTGCIGLGQGGGLLVSAHKPQGMCYPVRATLPGLYPEQLGSNLFRRVHGLRFAYVGGSMARGIASPELVMALSRIGAMGFYGSAGVAPDELESNLQVLHRELSTKGYSWGANLIHSPAAPELEEKTVDMFLKHRVTRAEVSAFMDMRPPVVRYACTGLKRAQNGGVIRFNHVFAKISRPETARHFMRPAPLPILRELVASGKLTENEADCASRIPIAGDITVESDSGGHTDNRPLATLFSRIADLRAELNVPVRLGAAGGLGTPLCLAGAFALGADYVMLGSVHQATLEAGISNQAREMLAQIDIADVGMTASADMFEQGVKVQVVTRGTMMAARGNRLYQLYKKYASLDQIPAPDRAFLEKNIFHESLENAWQRVRERALKRNSERVLEADGDPKLKMAMLFRAYLGQSSRWPIFGNPDRRSDYQIWCGPAMGAFNSWVKNSFLADPESRSVEQVALNLLRGAAEITRIQQLRLLGLPVSANTWIYSPRPLSL